KTIDRNKELLFLRERISGNYDLSDERYILKGTELTIDEIGSPTFAGIRQRDMNGKLECRVDIDSGEAGISVFMDESHHYDIKLRDSGGICETVLTLNIGSIKHEQKVVSLTGKQAVLKISFDSHNYHFYVNGEYMGSAGTRYLSSEISGGFTGVLFGMFAQNGGIGTFSGFRLAYSGIT
ncbi:MAG: glycoside hydrolase family 43 protein, partial [Oscillospiraceae bacterium]|nr:glycoside hydrolase family 43 protein [Oscillospiraceae bacterium]